MVGKWFLLPVFILAVFMSVFFAYAVLSAVTLTAPADNANVTGTITLNASFGSAADVANATFYISNGTVAQPCQNLSGSTGYATCSFITTTAADGIYTFNVTAENGTVIAQLNDTSLNVRIDNTAPIINFVSSTPAANTNNSGAVTINVTVNDTGINQLGLIVIRNSTGVLTTCATSPCNLSSITFADGSQTINVTANDSLGNLNASVTRNVTIDSTVPLVQFGTGTPANSTTQSGNEQLNITASDATTSVQLIRILVDGVEKTTCTTSPCTYTWDTTAYSNGYHNFTGRANDSANNVNSSIDTRLVLIDNGGSGAGAGGSGGAGGDGGGGAGGAAGPKVRVFDQITPGAAAIQKITDPEFGIRQINISVINPAQNVTITVTKLEGQPAEVTVTLSGNVFQFIEVDAENLPDTNIRAAEISFTVRKDWLAQNLASRDDVRLYRFHNGNWQELSTQVTGETDDEVEYSASTSGFSTFAIATTMTEPSPTPEPTPPPAPTPTPSPVAQPQPLPNMALIIIVGILVVLGILYYSKKKPKRSRY